MANLNNMNIEILMGPTAKTWLNDFAAQLDRMEKLLAKTNGESEPMEKEEIDQTPMVAKGKRGRPAKAISFDDEEPTETICHDAPEEEEAEESEEAWEAAPKKTKVKKFTADDINDACKERAARTTRAEVLGILKKFKVKSVSDLEESDYEAVIKALKK